MCCVGLTLVIDIIHHMISEPIVVLLLVFIYRGCSMYRVSGHWRDINDTKDEYSMYYKWRGPIGEQSFNDSEEIIQNFYYGSPCRALTIRDNCYSHNSQRAEHLLIRKWIKHEAIKARVDVSKPGTLVDILSDLKNKTISIVGDSTVLSVFASLACHLSQQETPHYRFSWLFERKQILLDAKGQTVCPMHVSCYILSGEVYYPHHNITLWYQQLNTYSKRSRELLHTVVESTHNRPDIVLINFGVHYNEYKAYITDLFNFQKDMEGIMERQKMANAHQISWHWIESFPQHFSHGYFNYSADSRIRLSAYNPSAHAETSSRNVSLAHTTNSLHCTAIANATYYYQEDWRNRLAELVLPEFYTNHRVIKVAEPLYDQWDAHVDYGDSRRVTKAAADCTHYCTSSGVFRFVLSEVLSSVKRCLHGHCPDRYFFYPPMRTSPEAVHKALLEKKRKEDIHNKIRAASKNKASAQCVSYREGGLRNRQVKPNC